MITVHQFAPGHGLPSTSPFCTKVQTYLRMVGLPYEVKNHDRPTPGPKNKLPFVDDEGTIVPDSSAIIAHFEAKISFPLDASLSASDRAVALAVKRLAEEHFYFVLAHERFEGPGWEVLRRDFAAQMPVIVRSFVPDLIRKGIRKMNYAQGVGRHTPAEVQALGIADLDALSAILGSKAYLLGDVPRTIDATVYAFLATALVAEIPTPVKDHALRHSNLVSYVKRLRTRYFPDAIVEEKAA